MKTYKEFILEAIDVYERYYEPDEKLPSGRTPSSSANNALSKAFKNRKNPTTRERTKKLSDKIRTNVRFNANSGVVNPNISREERGKIKTNVDDEGFTNIKHNDSGVTYHVKDQGDAYEVHWSHDKNKNELTPGQRVRLGTAADKLFKSSVVPRLRNGRLIVTRASSDDTLSKKEKKQSNAQNIPSRRADIYSRRGFSQRDTYGYITGKIRKRRGSNSIDPISPVKTHERLNSTHVKNAIRNPNNLTADYDKKTEGLSKQDRKKPNNSDELSITSTERTPIYQNLRGKNRSNRKIKSPKQYSGNISRNNPITLRSLERENEYRDVVSEK